MVNSYSKTVIKTQKQRNSELSSFHATDSASLISDSDKVEYCSNLSICNFGIASVS